MAQDNNKMFTAIQARSLRSLVDQANALGLTKDNVVQVVQNDEGFFLLYYK